MRRRSTTALLVAVLSCAAFQGVACFRSSTLPDLLTDEQFSGLSARLSEPAGAFALSDNLVSNEPQFAESVRRLRPSGGVYIGVGPEQNFSYIARLQPAMAFIVDIRRENRNLHLLYKALFELSADRAEFISRLFSRPRPEGLGADASVEELFARFDPVLPSRELYDANASLVRQRLLAIRGLTWAPTDLAWIDDALDSFRTEGPAIDFWASPTTDSVQPSYRQLMTAVDAMGRSRSYLATADDFAFVKNLHTKNLIVPVIGDFAGPRALRGVGEYVREHRSVLHAFYASNVAVYLTRDQTREFCRSLTTLPFGSPAWFIENRGARSAAATLKACAARGSPAPQ